MECITHNCCFWDQANESCTLYSEMDLDDSDNLDEFFRLCPAVESDSFGEENNE